MTGEPIVLVNRTSEPLQFTANSRHYILKPGPNYGYTEGHAPYALKQNPLMGTENYYSLDFVSKVGIEGRDEYPCTPIPDEDLLIAMDSQERFNRQEAGLAEKIAVRARHGRTGRMASLTNENSLAIGG